MVSGLLSLSATPKFRRRSECVPNGLGFSLTLPIHSDARCAYWRMIMLEFAPRRSVNKKSPGVLSAAFR
jgi:hypothetical protein